MGHNHTLRLVHEHTINGTDYDDTLDFTGDCISMLKYQVERYCKRNHIKIISKTGRNLKGFHQIPVDKYMCIWFVNTLGSI